MTAALILAAGASTRLGSPKQMARLGAETLLERTVRVAHSAGCAPVLVVLGAHAEQIRTGCDLSGAQVEVHSGWAEGMGSTLRFGVQQLLEADAIVVLTCDQPAVTEGHLRRLILEAEGVGGAVGSSYAGRRGVPACFPAAEYGALLQVSGDAGARSLLAAAPAVELPDGELDVDTEETLRAAQSRFS